MGYNAQFALPQTKDRGANHGVQSTISHIHCRRDKTYKIHEENDPGVDRGRERVFADKAL